MIRNTCLLCRSTSTCMENRSLWNTSQCNHYRMALGLPTPCLEATNRKEFSNIVFSTSNEVLKSDPNVQRPVDYLSRPILQHSKREYIPLRKQTQITALKKETAKLLTRDSGTFNCSVSKRISLSLFSSTSMAFTFMNDASHGGRVNVIFSGSLISSIFRLSTCKI